MWSPAQGISGALLVNSGKEERRVFGQQRQIFWTGSVGFPAPGKSLFDVQPLEPPRLGCLAPLFQVNE